MKCVRKDFDQEIQRINSRGAISNDVFEAVGSVIEKVKTEGDPAVRYYTEKWDGCRLENIRVSEAEINYAFNQVSEDLVNYILEAKKNIENFHQLGIRSSHYLEGDGYTLGELVRPLNRVGIYIPGGKAAYPSTVLMNGVPAILAGVKEIVMITPPDKDGQINDLVLATAKILGIQEIYKIGGAQGIAALSFGTESIRPVDKIVGPGNAYVAAAKQLLSYRTGIDMIAGPSEILILADETAKARYIAADLIAQAEHDEKAAVMVITQSEFLKDQIVFEVENQLEGSERKSIIQQAINAYGTIFMVQNDEEMIEIANQIAPEHLELMLEKNEKFIDRLVAGAIFDGQYSPEALGDYYAGPNHTLPTNGTARFSSPLSVDDFIKKTSYIKYSKEALIKASKAIEAIADSEGLFGHGNSIKVRREL